MCYKEERQDKLEEKFKAKSEGLPKFILSYFTFLKSNNTKINNLGTLLNLFEWLLNNNIVKNKSNELTIDDMKAVGEEDIAEYLNQLNKVMGYTSVITKMNVIGGFWKYLFKKKYVTENIVTDEVRALFKEEVEREIEVPSDESVERLLINLNNKKSEYNSIKYIAIVRLLIGSAIRLEEIAGLDIDDVCLDEKEPYVLVMGKGKQNQKSKVAINKLAANALDDYLKTRKVECEGFDIKALFINKDHKNNTVTRLSYRAIQDTIDRYSNGEIHAHLLRHYALTKMHENGNDMAIISKQARHKKMDTTMKFYARISEDAIYKALNSY